MSNIGITFTGVCEKRGRDRKTDTLRRYILGNVKNDELENKK